MPRVEHRAELCEESVLVLLLGIWLCALKLLQFALLLLEHCAHAGQFGVDVLVAVGQGHGLEIVLS